MSKDVKVYFTSDPHFKHRLVAAHRGFVQFDVAGNEVGDTEAHDAKIMDNWRAAVRPQDIIWVLGDLGMSANPTPLLDIIAQLPGRKRLISGNHDAVHPMHTRAYRWFGAYAEVFEFVAPFAKTRVQGMQVALSHFPYLRDRGPSRYMEWRLRNEKMPLIHGHTHGPERLFANKDAQTVEVHVGLDAWGLKPVRDTEIFGLMHDGNCILKGHDVTGCDRMAAGSHYPTAAQ